MKRLLSLLMPLFALTMLAQDMQNLGRLTTANGLPDNSILRLCLDSYGLLWIGTDAGLGRYDGYEVSSIMKYTDPEGKEHPLGSVHHIRETEDGNLLLDVGNGEMVYDRKTHRVTSSGKSIVWYTETEMRDHMGTSWKFNFDNDTISFQQTSGAWEKMKLTDDVGNAVRGMVDDGKGHLWIATNHRGLFCMEQATPEKQVEHYPMDYNLNCIVCDSYGTLWMGDYKRGVLFWNPSADIFHHYDVALGDVSALLTARDGRLWVGTEGQGVFVDGHCAGLDGKVVTALAEDGEGRIWAGTYGEGLFVDGKKVEVVGNRKVSTVNVDARGCIWVGSHFDPLVCYDPRTGFYREVKTAQGESIYSLSATTDREGNMLFGTYYGIWHINVRSGQQTFILSAKNGKKFLSQQSTSMLQDGRGIFWLGHLDGVTMWNPVTDEVRHITQESDGLSYGRVRGMVADGEGRIVVATTRGVSAIMVDNRGRVESVVTYNSPLSVGSVLAANRMTSDIVFSPNAVALLSDGQPVFGTTSGYVAIDQHLLCGLTNDSVWVEFSEIAASGKLLDENANELRLRYDDYNITLRLFTNHLYDATLCRFAYRLEGMQNEWIVTTSPLVSFGTLPSGSYVFAVKAQIAGGQWSEERRLRIVVVPPFWASTWMKVVYALLAVALVVLIFLNYRRRQHEKMERQRREMELDSQMRLNDAKLRFFTNISHDLRTPLTLIVSPLQSLLKESLPDSAIKRLRVIDKNANLLMQQIGSLLDFRKLDAGAERLNATQGNLVELVQGVCDEFMPYAKERSIELRFGSKVERLLCSFDVEKIHKVLYNLLSNAFKFTDAEGHILVMVDSDGQQATVSVADDGCGISDKDKPHLFERFYQSHTNEQQPGSGIGLHIVNEYVHLHEGTVSVTDNKPKGAVFTFSIPIKNVDDLPELKQESEKPEVVDNSPTDGKYTILFVDDNHDLCEFVSDSFADKYHLLTAHDGLEALDVLARENVNVVVSDVMMPNMNGLELCNHIKGNIQLSHIPVLLLTAKTAEASVLEGLRMGADDYLTKPFNIDVLQLRIEKFIEWSQRAHQTFQQKIEVEPNEITITPLDEQFIARAIKIVEDHLTDSDFTVETLGSELAMNRVSLWRKIQNLTGRGPADFIRLIRLKRGKQLLEKSQMQVSEIAYSVGYNTVKRFTENFKTEFGMTPTQYRNAEHA